MQAQGSPAVQCGCRNRSGSVTTGGATTPVSPRASHLPSAITLPWHRPLFDAELQPGSGPTYKQLDAEQRAALAKLGYDWRYRGLGADRGVFGWQPQALQSTDGAGSRGQKQV
jgi:hypothetical protein